MSRSFGSMPQLLSSGRDLIECLTPPNPRPNYLYFHVELERDNDHNKINSFSQQTA